MEGKHSRSTDGDSLRAQTDRLDSIGAMSDAAVEIDLASLEHMRTMPADLEQGLERDRRAVPASQETALAQVGGRTPPAVDRRGC